MPHALIVGASRGLGRALAEEHLKRGWHVTATVRQADALADIAGNALDVEVLDTTDWAGIDRLRDRMSPGTLDLLFVNAGIMGPSDMPIGEADPDAFVELMLVNVLAPLRIVDRLADRTADTGTVAVMSSGLGSLANNNGGYEAYRSSKAALNQGMRSIASRRKDARTYLACCPGWVRTDMGGPGATFSIDQSIPSLTDALAARAGQGGVAYINQHNQVVPW